MFSRPEKLSNEDTIWYEIDILRFSYSRLTSNQPRADVACEKFLYLECFLLHYRNLLACFSGKHHKRNSDDIDFSNLADWTSGQILSEGERRRIVDAAVPLDDQYYDDISKYLAHLTSRRLDDRSWDAVTMSCRIEHVINLFSEQFPRARRFCDDRITSAVSPNAASTATVVEYDTFGNQGRGT